MHFYSSPYVFNVFSLFVFLYLVTSCFGDFRPPKPSTRSAATVSLLALAMRTPRRRHKSSPQRPWSKCWRSSMRKRREVWRFSAVPEVNMTQITLPEIIETISVAAILRCFGNLLDSKIVAKRWSERCVLGGIAPWFTVEEEGLG